jgi:O-antigen/teichoic acid export membrane protein
MASRNRGDAPAMRLPTVKTFSQYVRSQPAHVAGLIVAKVGADVVSKSVTLLITVVAARVLPATEFGVLALAMTTGWLLGVASDAGLPLFVAKVVARHRGLTPLARRALAHRAGLAVAALAAAAGLGAVLMPTAYLPAFVVIAAAQILGAWFETVAHVFRGMNRTDIESALTIAYRGATAVLAVAALLSFASLLPLAFALAVPVAAALPVAWALAASSSSTGAAAASEASVRLRDFAPVGLGILCSALYFRVGLYFLEHWHGVEAVGEYNAAFRIVEAARLLPAAALAVQFAVLCRAVDLRPLRLLTAALAVPGLVAGGVVYAAAAALLTVLYGERFAAAAPALQLLGVALPLFFINYALTHQVIAWDGYVPYLATAATALAASIVSNALLIPRGGMEAAAAATIITELVVTIGCVVALVAARTSPVSWRAEVS